MKYWLNQKCIGYNLIFFCWCTMLVWEANKRNCLLLKTETNPGWVVTLQSATLQIILDFNPHRPSSLADGSPRFCHSATSKRSQIINRKFQLVQSVKLSAIHMLLYLLHNIVRLLQSTEDLTVSPAWVKWGQVARWANIHIS